MVQPSLVEGFRQQVHFEHICPASASGKPGNPVSKIGPMGTNVLVDVSTGISLALDPAMHAHKLTKRERERERERLNWSLAQKSQLKLTWSTDDDDELNKDE